MNIPADIGAAGRSIGDLFNYLGGMSYYQAPARAPSYTVRGATFNDEDLKNLGATMFNEVGNSDPNEQAIEAKAVANTLINRMAQYKAQGGRYSNWTPTQALSAPNQYQGYGGGEFKRYMAGSTTPVDQPKMNAINGVLNSIRSGNLADTTGGRVFYTNYQTNPTTSKLYLRDGSLFGPQQNTRTLADLQD